MAVAAAVAEMAEMVEMVVVVVAVAGRTRSGTERARRRAASGGAAWVLCLCFACACACLRPHRSGARTLPLRPPARVSRDPSARSEWSGAARRGRATAPVSPVIGL